MLTSSKIKAVLDAKVANNTFVLGDREIKELGIENFLNIYASPEQVLDAIKLVVTNDKQLTSNTLSFSSNLTLTKKPKIALSDIQFVANKKTITKTKYSLSCTVLCQITIQEDLYEGSLSMNPSGSMVFAVTPKKGMKFPGIDGVAGRLLGDKELDQRLAGVLTELKMNALAVQGMEVGFNLNQKTLTFLALKTTFTLANVPLQLRITLPDLGINGILSPHAKIKVDKVFDHFFPNSLTLPDATISNLNFFVDISSGGFKVKFEIDKDWPFAISTKAKLLFSQVAIEIEKSKTGASGNIFALCSIGGIDFPVGASYKEDTWKFQGSTETGKSFQLNDVLSQIAKELKLTHLQLPDALSPVKVTDVVVSFTSNSGSPTFSGSVSSLPLRQLLNAFLPDGCTIPKELFDLEIESTAFLFDPSAKTISIEIKTQGNWIIPVGIDNLTISQVSFSLKKHGNQTTITIGGNLTIGQTPFDVHYHIPGEFEIKGDLGDIQFKQLAQSLCGPVDIIPKNFPDLMLRKTSVTIKKDKALFSLSSGAQVDGFGAISLTLEKTNTWGLAGRIDLSETWKLSDLSDSLTPLDVFEYKEPSLIVSTMDAPSTMPDAKAGITFQSVCVPTTGPVQDLCKVLQLPQLNARMLFAKEIAKSELSLSIETDLAVGKALTFSGLGFSIHGAPFSAGFFADLTALIEKDKLAFKASADVSGAQSTVSCEMVGDWHDPFGTKGLVLEDTVFSIDFGAIPGFGLAGSLAFNKKDKLTLECSFIGGAAPELLLGSYTGKITFADVVGVFSKEKLPKSFKSYFIQDFELGMVTNPLGVQLGSKRYAFGNTIKGILGFEGLQADIEIKSSIDSFAGHGRISPLVLDNGHVIITDLKGKKGPEVDFEIAPLKETMFYISGKIIIYESGVGSQLQITDDSYQFQLRTMVFNSFMAQVHATAAYGSIFNASFSVDVELEGDFFEYIQTEVAGSITKEAEKAQAGLSKASSDVEKAKAKVATLEVNVQRAKDKANKNNLAAQQKLDGAQKKVDDTNVLIQILEKAVKNAQDKAAQKSAQANANLSKAQKNVETAQKALDSLNAQIKKKQSDAKYYDKKRYSKKVKSSYKVTSVVPPKGYWKYKTVKYAKASDKARAAKLWADANTLKAGLAAKTTFLSATKESLKLAKKTSQITPVSANPDVILQQGKLDTANHSLKMYRQTLSDLKKTIKMVPVDLDPTVVYNQGLLDTANITLDHTQKILDNLNKGAGSVAELGEKVQASASYVKVTKAGFGGQLSATSGGQVSMNLDLLVEGKKRKYTLEFDFNNPLIMIGNLVSKLVAS